MKFLEIILTQNFEFITAIIQYAGFVGIADVLKLVFGALEHTFYVLETVKTHFRSIFG